MTGADFPGKVKAAALVVQNLLVDNKGEAVPSPLVYVVQLRAAAEDRSTTTILREFELSRRTILKNPASGGLRDYSDGIPAYLPGAGNDYSFAPPVAAALRSPPIRHTLRRLSWSKCRRPVHFCRGCQTSEGSGRAVDTGRE